MSSEIEIKTGRLTEMLAAEKLGGVLINAQRNFAWLTAGKSNAIDTATESGVSFLFVRRDGKKFVLANNIEMPRILAEDISAEEFEPIEFLWTEEKSSKNFIFKTAQALLSDKSEIASDILLDSSFRTIEDSIALCRYSLTDTEIERYRNLGKDAGAAFGKVFERINAGETELEIAQKIKDALAEFDFQPMVTLVGADQRISQFRHPIPTKNIWKKILLTGVCARREGLIANLSRLACIGEIPAEMQSRTEACADVCAKILLATQVEKTGAELYAALKNAYAENNFAEEIFKHHQGGACGYKTRDWIAHPKSAQTVFPNQAFAWNPTITGTKIEETCIISENNFEIITATPDFPSIEIEAQNRKIRLPAILNL